VIYYWDFLVSDLCHVETVFKWRCKNTCFKTYKSHFTC